MVALALRVARRREPRARHDGCRARALARPPCPTAPRRSGGWSLPARRRALLLPSRTTLPRNIASVPLLWLMPLTIYLVTFILCFDGQRWYSLETYFGPVLIAIGRDGLDARRQDPSVRPAEPGCSFRTRPLHRLHVLPRRAGRVKPHPAYLGRFYAIVSLGGAIGSATSPSELRCSCRRTTRWHAC
jgi:hypothetical protein